MDSMLTDLVMGQRDSRATGPTQYLGSSCHKVIARSPLKRMAEGHSEPKVDAECGIYPDGQLTKEPDRLRSNSPVSNCGWTEWFTRYFRVGVKSSEIIAHLSCENVCISMTMPGRDSSRDLPKTEEIPERFRAWEKKPLAINDRSGQKSA
jgi:hypothetical protein